MNQASSNYRHGHADDAQSEVCNANFPLDEHGVPILYEVVAPERWHQDHDPAADAGEELPADIVPRLEMLLQARLDAAVDAAVQHAMEQALQSAERHLRDDLHSQLRHALPTLIAEVLEKRSGH
ncbi:MAG TPA: hypothetical protein VKA76_09480 [Gammaproteobacteria bacterium]|nr:hypothetical protein [Gammaproteobacteria bacterium]